MATDHAQSLVNFMPATLDVALQSPADAWFALAAIIVLWAYVLVAPDRDRVDA